MNPDFVPKLKISAFLQKNDPGKNETNDARKDPEDLTAATDTSFNDPDSIPPKPLPSPVPEPTKHSRDPN